MQRAIAARRAAPARGFPVRLATCLAHAALMQGLLPGAAAASADPSVICEQAALQASQDSGVPLDVLRAISLTETGRRHEGRFRPWPWTVNMQGTGVWFDNPDEALAYVERKFGSGARSFDVGCFQINYKWHGQAFASIAQMFEPDVNARYAANLLRSLYGELGSWSAAAGAYHSRTPEYATRYRDRFDRIRARLTGQPTGGGGDALLATSSPSPPGGGSASGDVALPGGDGVIPEIPDIVLAMNGGAAPPPQRVNRYPLLQAGGPFAPVLGSLVPPAAGPVVALFGPKPSAGPTEVAAADDGARGGGGTGIGQRGGGVIDLTGIDLSALGGPPAEGSGRAGPSDPPQIE